MWKHFCNSPKNMNLGRHLKERWQKTKQKIKKKSFAEFSVQRWKKLTKVYDKPFVMDCFVSFSGSTYWRHNETRRKNPQNTKKEEIYLLQENKSLSRKNYGAIIFLKSLKSFRFSSFRSFRKNFWNNMVEGNDLTGGTLPGRPT